MHRRPALALPALVMLLAAGPSCGGGGPAAAPAATPPAAVPAATLADCDAPARTRVLQAQAALPPAWDHAQGIWLDAQRLRWPQAAADPGTRFRLVHSAAGTLALAPGQPVAGADRTLALQPADAPPPAEVAARFPHVRGGVLLELAEADRGALPELLRGQLLLVQEDAAGRVQRATATQHPGALDRLYAAAGQARLGAVVGGGRTAFALWAPTATAVSLCLYPDARGAAAELLPMARDAQTGVWRLERAGDLSGRTYDHLVDVHQRPAGLVRHRVGDPYALSLTADSRRSAVVDLDAPALKPAGWDATPRPAPRQHNTDLVIYELHVRDFSAGDRTVAAAHRGRYGAFTETASDGMRHLAAMAAAGLTDVHLLPVFDLATVPETGCLTPAIPDAPPDSERQQAAVAAVKERDCFNWGYDPLFFNAPEGSYASDADDPAVRVREFRAMVQALHRLGLRVGMDVVYNHTSASGLHANSVLDRIVPGYYQRLDADGRVETSTCCDNTATEHLMMAKLMIDSAVVWAREHRIDSFRFDLMGHQPREAMLRLQQAVDAAAGRRVQLIGEGWNFGEVANGARFRQAIQGELAGTGIATFSDRGRDALRGGGCCDGPQEVLRRQGWLNGLHHDRNEHAAAAGAGTREELLRTADLVRLALAGTLRELPLTTHDGSVRRGAEIDYAGGPAGYAAEPGEVVNYVENHDNPTLFDIHVMKLPRATSREDRARVQVLGIATTAFSQGVAYFHAGIEILRSKSLDRNSYDSGDWFNRIDWTLSDNGFGSGLPLQSENGAAWPVMRPLLADAAAIRPTPAQIRFTRDAFLDLLRIRTSTTLLRLPSAAEIAQRLRFHNTGPAQDPTVIVGHLDGRGLAGARFDELLYAINVANETKTLALPALAGRPLVLHPVHRAPGAADPRPALQARWDAASGTLTVPPRTALVYVLGGS